MSIVTNKRHWFISDAQSVQVQPVIYPAGVKLNILVQWYIPCNSPERALLVLLCAIFTKAISDQPQFFGTDSQEGAQQC